MAYIDYAYYSDTFHGTSIAQNAFDRLAEIASDVIDGLVAMPASTLDASSPAYEKVKKACAYLVESIDANGGIDAITGFSSSEAQSESLADYSISKSAGSQSGVNLQFGDIKIPVIAYSLLQSAGLMNRWVYAGTVIDDAR